VLKYIQKMWSNCGAIFIFALNQILKTMATVQFFTRSTAKNKVVNLQCRLRAGRNIDLTAYSGINVNVSHWSNKTQTVKNIADATEKDKKNAKIRELSNHILKELTNAIPSKQWLEEAIDKFHNPEKYEHKQETLFTFIEEFIAKAPTRINPKSGQPVCYKMQREYERTFYYLKGFADKNKCTIDFKDIDLDFYHDFILYLQSLNKAKNTIGKKIQTLKIFLNAATDANVNTNMSYKSHRFTVISEESDNIYLNEEELKTMYELDLTKNKRLERVRDLFIVGCWTGLRYGDWHKVNSKSIDDGFIEIRQSKTSNPVIIPVHTNVLNILDKYDGVLPSMISDQKLRDYLKEVAEMAGITEEVEKTITKGGITRTTKYKKWQRVGTHTARRSFATNMYKRGIPTITIMAITGHKTETSFLKYIKVTPREHAEKMREMWNRQAMKVVNE